MSLESLLDRVAYTVTSVTSPKTPDVTEKPYIKQRGYVGYVGYVEKNKIQSEKQKTPSSSAVSSSSDSVICKHIVDTLKTADYSFLTFGRYGVTNNHHLDDQDDAAHVSNFAQTFVFSDVTDVTASNGAGCSGYAKKNTEVTGVTVYAAPSGDTYSEWLVTHSTGERAIHCFAPPKSRAEVLALYQGATVEPAPPEPEPTPLPPDAIPLVYAYLNHVGETCPATRTEFVTALERDHRRLAWLYGEVVRMGLAEVAA